MGRQTCCGNKDDRRRRRRENFLGEANRKGLVDTAGPLAGKGAFGFRGPCVIEACKVCVFGVFVASLPFRELFLTQLAEKRLCVFLPSCGTDVLGRVALLCLFCPCVAHNLRRTHTPGGEPSPGEDAPLTHHGMA